MARKRAFPLWPLVLGHVSHFLLVLNSSGNCLIYCLMSKKFRKHFSLRFWWVDPLKWLFSIPYMLYLGFFIFASSAIAKQQEV